MRASQIRQAIDAVGQSWIDHADELTRLDLAIGDGDHGANLRRGAEAVMAAADSIAERPLPEALAAIGQILVDSVGGAAGPLYATFFMALGRALPDEPDLAEWNFGLREAVVAVAKRGRASAGEKTMLDVIVPAQLAFAQTGLPESVEAAACDGADATIAMQARRGRAAYFAERSVGHMDPGARSSALAVSALCGVWSAPQ